MERIDGYRVVESDTLKELSELVNALLSKGWKPIGGIAIAFEPAKEGSGEYATNVYAQAMVQTSED